jgi:hypothetical protein
VFNFFKKKKKKRNEIAIFQEFELKPEDFREEIPNKEDLEPIDDIYFYNDKLLKRNTYWREVDSELIQVDEYGESLDEDDKDYQKEIPNTSKLKEYKTDVKFFVEEEKEDMIICTWWKQNEQGQLTQVNLSGEGESVKFKMKAWLRKEAINAVKLEINTMKKRAYEYEKEELLQMIEKEEKKIIKKQGWKWVRRLALASLGIGFIPGL